MPTPHRRPQPPDAAGAALPVGLLLLLVMTFLALAGSRLGRLELQISLNDERQAQAQQNAQSLVDAALAAFRNTPPLAPGERRCQQPAPDPDPTAPCADASPLHLPTAVLPDDPAHAGNVIVTRLPPVTSAPPIGSGFSATRFQLVQIRVAGIFDGTAHGLGSARIDEGLGLLVPAPAGVTVLDGPGL